LLTDATPAYIKVVSAYDELWGYLSNSDFVDTTVTNLVAYLNANSYTHFGCDTGMFQNDPGSTQYATNADFQDAWAYFLNRLYTEVRTANRRFTINTGSADFAVFTRMMAYYDICLKETLWSVGASIADKRASALGHWTLMDWCAANGKGYCVRHLDVTTIPTEAEHKVARGCVYLGMGGEGEGYYALAGDSDTHTWYPSVDNLNEGKPLTARLEAEAYVYFRLAQRGLWVVNLSAHDFVWEGGTIASGAAEWINKPLGVSGLEFVSPGGLEGSAGGFTE
jgi:hypothetical protein